MLIQVLVVLAIAAAAFFSGISVEKGSEAKREVIRQQQAKEFDAENRRLERVRSEQTIKAINDARTREQARRVDSAGARTELDGLRNDVSTVTTGLSSADLDACRKQASTALNLFEQCAARYQGVAEAADAHAGDTLTLEAAWPD